jgi:hypothetical protein
MKDYARLHAAEGDYEIIIREVAGEDGPMWHGLVIFLAVDGTITSTRDEAVTRRADDPVGLEVRSLLLEAIGFYQHHRRDTGERWEVREMQEVEGTIDRLGGDVIEFGAPIRAHLRMSHGVGPG